MILSLASWRSYVGLLLIYQSAAAREALSESEMQEIMSEVDTLIGELTSTGEWVTGEALADAPAAKTVRIRDGVSQVTDGP